MHNEGAIYPNMGIALIAKNIYYSFFNTPLI